MSAETFIYPYSETVAYLQSSDIRDLMKYAIREDFISFAGGMPNNHLFPVDEVEKIYHNLPRHIKELSFQYGPTTGYPPLVEVMKKYMESKGIDMSEHRLMITTGSLQAIYIVTQLFADPGDTLITENPSFIGALTLFKSFQVKLHGVSMDHNGIIPEKLEETFRKAKKQNEKIKFLYVIPNFHNPAGLIYSKERRKFLLDFIEKNDLILLEDDAYNELYFSDLSKNKTVPVIAMAQDSQRQKIIYAGTFSKILGPGFRLGWLVLPEEIFHKAEIIKQSLDACSPNLSQVIAHAFIEGGYMRNYLQRIRPEYKLRRDLTIESVKKYFPQNVKYVEPQGGFYIWFELPEGISAKQVLDYAIDNGVVFVLGKSFDPARISDNTFRLAYSNVNPNDIRPGIKIIAEGIEYAMKT